MSSTPPMTRHDVEILRRSLAASGALSREQAEWVLAEARRLLDERDRVVESLGRLSSPWHDVRTVLNELHAVLAVEAGATPPPVPPAQRGRPASGRPAPR